MVDLGYDSSSSEHAYAIEWDNQVGREGGREGGRAGGNEETHREIKKRRNGKEDAPA
jgi:hypothetical protein